MKKNIFGIAGAAAVLSALGLVFAGCVSAPNGSSAAKAPPAALSPTLDESLRKYMGPQEQTWDEDDGKVTYVYLLDPLRFEEFKAGLDAEDEYVQTDNWTENNRDGDRGRAFARFAVRPDGRIELALGKEDNSVVWYRYKTALDPAAAQLAADLNAVKAGTVKLSGEVYLTTGLTVPAGVTLDPTAEGAVLLENGATLTVDGTVNARGYGNGVAGGLRIGDGTAVIIYIAAIALHADKYTQG
jgi:hypothetical protein